MKSSNKLLAFVVVLQVVLLMGQWLGQPSAQTAHADVQLPNPSERQLAILDELRTLNGKMDRLIGVMTSGDVKVEVTKVPAARAK
ncbi:MAG TPA: hypothetical protein VLJ39_22370 [Tepidisphaeraceae bacterium]|jgi:hypothetical protein|nr:hypothetical protein [Tepidisphaeraceae bacterium]